MNLKQSILIIFAVVLVNSNLFGQSETYHVEKTSFSSERYDEFSPVWYQNGIVFCSNRENNPFLDYSDSLNRGKIKMYYTDTIPGIKWRKANQFAKEIQTRLNFGPVTFNFSKDTIYYSRNQIVEGSTKKLSGLRNKLGLFSSVYDGNSWTKVTEFRFNSEWYNITTPYLSTDGKRLYFASDNPDGYGGADIYYCNWSNDYWEEPVNLGPEVNTAGNESYPFINDVGELFFSSDGHSGMGGKDIFVTKEKNNGWYAPIGLDAPVNSASDDFGIITDPLMTEGYFSSNRDISIDIYRFTSDKYPVWFYENQRVNNYCFTISDSGSIQIDTLKLQYEWDFGDDTRINGPRVDYCFNGPGSYSIELNIKDRRTGGHFFKKLSFDIEIVDIKQPFINATDYVISGEIVDFDGLKSFYPDYIITDYFWDFGEKSYGYGERVSHIFDESGEYDVKLGLILKSDANNELIKRAILKRIKVFNNEQERDDFVTELSGIRGIPLIGESETVIIKNHFSAEMDFMRESLFQVEIVSSPTRLDINSSFFARVPKKYRITEIRNSEDSTYSYIVDRQMTLMASYPAYVDLISSGYSDTRVSNIVLEDPAEKDLYNLKRKYGTLSDTYFDQNNKLVTNAFLMLNDVAMFLKRHPDIRLEIGVHTDTRGSAATNSAISKSKAQILIDYLINSGIRSSRLIAKGYGEDFQVAPNYLEKDRRLNRRVDFTIINE